jgi:hypothetical protein
MKGLKTKLPLTIRGVYLPEQIQNGYTEGHDVPYCFGIDWIEFTAANDLKGLPESPFLFTHEHSGHGSKYYNDMYIIKTIATGPELVFAELHVKPRVSFLDPHLVQVKIDNRFCYEPNLQNMIGDFCREYSLTFKNLTRFDIFCDFQKINQFGYEVQQFLNDCGTRRFVMKGKAMKPHWTRNECDGITWGSRCSGMSITVYNKTKEMLKKSWKPWISDLWDTASFDMDMDVFRLEFSMKKPKADIVDDNAEVLVFFDSAEMISDTWRLLQYCYSRHFLLAENVEGVRFSRMKRFFPLIVDASPFYPVVSCIKPKSTNYTKSYIKRLAIDALFYQKKGELSQSSFAYDHLLDVVKRHSLHKWFSEKFFWLNLKKSRLTLFDHMQSEFIKTHRMTKSALAFGKGQLPLHRKNYSNAQTN